MMDSTDSEWNTLLKIIERFGRYYNHCIASFAFGYYDENQKFCLFKIEYSKDSVQGEDIVNDYGNLKLSKRRLSIEDSKTLITNIRNNKLPLDDSSVDVDVRSGIRRNFIPSGKSYGLIDTDWPTHYFDCLLPSQPFKEIHPITLDARLELPLYSTILDAAVHFLDVNITNSSARSEIIIMIPDFRPRIKELHVIGKRLLAILETNIDNDSESELIVKFYSKGQSKREQSSK
ncbi:MAG: hypothetical protein WBF33_33975, partial [Candidatus Nitrosopolaris sp.]